MSRFESVIAALIVACAQGLAAMPPQPEAVAVEVALAAAPDQVTAVRLIPQGTAAFGTLSLPPGTYRAVVRDPAWWVQPEIEVAPGTSAVTIHAYRTGEVVLPLRAPAGAQLGAVRVAFSPCPEGRTVAREPRGSVVAEPLAGRARVRLPAACLDLVVASEAFAPVDVPGVQVAPEKVTTLPPATLLAGGSVAGLVVAASDGLGLAGVPVMLRGPHPAPEERSPASVRTMRAETNVRGAFRFAGLAAGAYTLTVGGGGWAAQTFDEVPVVEGREFTVRTVEVGPPATLAVNVSPPTDPAGRSWRLSLATVAEPLRTLSAATTDGQGEAVFDGLPAGQFLVRVEQGPAQQSPLLAEATVAVEWGQRDELPISLALCEVRGTVRLGDEPLPAHLRLAAAEGTTAATWELDTTEKGSFATLIPKPGAYTIELAATDGGSAAATTVQVRACGENLDVRLPATRLAGRVVWEDGEPAAGAHILLSRDVTQSAGGSDRARARADGEGRFAFVGLEPGTVVVEATMGGAWSDRQVAVVAEKRPVSDLTLTLPRTRELEGFLHDEAGTPVAAEVTAVWYAPGRSGTARGVAGRDGRFAVAVGARAERVALVVKPQSRPWTTALVRCCDAFRVIVPSTAATVTVRPLGGSWEKTAQELQWVLRHEGVYLPPGELYAWAGVQRGWRNDGGVPLPLPPLAAGPWEVCTFRDLATMEGTITTGTQPPCTPLSLLPGEEITLDLADLLRWR